MNESAPQTNGNQGGSSIFFGENGLRAGWGLLLFVIISALLITLLVAGVAVLEREHLLTLDLSTHEISPLATLFGEGIQFFAIAVAAWMMSRIERRPFGVYGLAARRMLPDFFAGALWGVAALSLLVGMLWATHAISFNGVLLAGAAVWVDAAEWASIFLLVGLFEEFLFRGYLQFTLTRGVEGIVRAVSPGARHVRAIGFWVAAFLLSVVAFAWTHVSNNGETLLGIVAVALAGTVFVFSLWRTGTLWWAIGFHSAWDWAQSYLYGTPDSGALSQGRLLATHPLGSRLISGGTDGPEGSVLVIPTLLLVGVVIHFTLPRRGVVGMEERASPGG